VTPIFTNFQNPIITVAAALKGGTLNFNIIQRGAMKFTIEVEMKDRWVPQFLAMLEYMRYLGGIGSSRKVCFYSDGDGDFRPKFKWSPALNSTAKPMKDDNGNRLYDAG